MSLEIRVDREACQGAGACLLRAPRTFELDEDGIVRVRAPEDPEAEILAAARACPHFALEVHRDGKRLA